MHFRATASGPLGSAPHSGAERVHSFPDAVAYGVPDTRSQTLWIQAPIDGQPATVGNGSHIGFAADSAAMVDAFWTTPLAAGAAPDGPPGGRGMYGAAYYGCFVRDRDGHKIEAYWIDPAKRE